MNAQTELSFDRSTAVYRNVCLSRLVFVYFLYSKAQLRFRLRNKNTIDPRWTRRTIKYIRRFSPNRGWLARFYSTWSHIILHSLCILVFSTKQFEALRRLSKAISRMIGGCTFMYISKLPIMRRQFGFVLDVLFAINDAHIAIILRLMADIQATL